MGLGEIGFCISVVMLKQNAMPLTLRANPSVDFCAEWVPYKDLASLIPYWHEISR